MPFTHTIKHGRLVIKQAAVKKAVSITVEDMQAPWKYTAGALNMEPIREDFLGGHLGE